jgi:hypothetical protein
MFSLALRGLKLHMRAWLSEKKSGPPRPAPQARKEAIKRRAAGETLAEIAKSYAVDISMISRLR